MRPCQAAPAFETTMSTPPKVVDHLVEGRAHRCGVGDVAARRRARRRRSPWPVRCRGSDSTSSSATSAPAAANALAVAAPIAPPAPVTTAIWPASGFSFACAELGLFDRPVFAVEHVGFGDRLEAADRLGVGDGRDRGLGEIGGDRARPWPSGRARTGRAPAPARRGAADRPCVLPPPTRALWRAKYCL